MNWCCRCMLTLFPLRLHGVTAVQDIEEVKFDRVNTAMGTVQRTFDLVVRVLTMLMVPCRCHGGR